MKTIAALALTASMANMVAGHAIFQQLWVNGEDKESTCVRMPASNSPVQDPTSNDMRCNAGAAAAPSTCGVKAGDTITVEMHQHNTRACSEEAIGGAHHGPVMIYLSSVDDAAAADGSSEFFKVFESGYFANNNTWGNDLINEGCGKQNFVIPSDIAPGDYLLRAETVALHAAGSENGAQYYMSVSGSGTAKPAGVTFPGAYKATDPGLLINIYNTISNYVIPGPAVYGAGSAGSDSGSAPASSAAASAPAATSAAAASSAPAAAAPTTLVTSAAAAPSSAAPTSAAAASTTSAAATAPTSGSGSGCKRRRAARKARRSAQY